MTPERPVDPRRSKLASEVAVRLRQLRARLDLTQDEVAGRVGCHESAISRWESGARLPSCQDLIELARVYGVSCDALLGVTEIAVSDGSALLDQALLDRLDAAETTEQFDAVVQERREHSVWIPIEDGARIVSLKEAVRRANAVAGKFPDSAHAGKLFRP
ncbi:MAG: helix-turn-helix transcriptional regulator [Planctomycetes bacterium]|nr:helix-turn-helix transcriptional regulator [Planctomycetota bacterium]